MAKKKTSGETSARLVLDVLKKNYAFSPDTAIGIDKFKNLKLSAAIIAYTIANLMENGVVERTEDERYYFNEENWKKIERKASYGYVFLLLIPIICAAAVILVQHLLTK